MSVLAVSANADLLGEGVESSWWVNSDHTQLAAAPYDSMSVYDGYKFASVNNDFKVKFIEVGESSAKMTRYDFATAAAAGFLGHNPNPPTNEHQLTVYVGANGCWAFEVVDAYDGSYTLSSGVVLAIRFEMSFFYSGDCAYNPLQVSFVAKIVNPQPGQNLFWRIVAYDIPNLGSVACLAGSFKSFNGGNFGAFTTIQDNMIIPTPGSQGTNNPNDDPELRIEAVCNTPPFRQMEVQMPANGVNEASDLIALLNSGSDKNWDYDRRPAELIHEAVNNELYSSYTQTYNARLRLMFEFQSGIFYDDPSPAYVVTFYMDLKNF